MPARMAALRKDDIPGVVTMALPDKDLNADGKLDIKDGYKVLVTDVDGKNLRPLIPGYVTEFSYRQLQDHMALISYSDSAGRKSARFNSDILGIEEAALLSLP